MSRIMDFDIRFIEWDGERGIFEVRKKGIELSLSFSIQYGYTVEELAVSCGKAMEAIDRKNGDIFDPPTDDSMMQNGQDLRHESN